MACIPVIYSKLNLTQIQKKVKKFSILVPKYYFFILKSSVQLFTGQNNQAVRYKTTKGKIPLAISRFIWRI